MAEEELDSRLAVELRDALTSPAALQDMATAYGRLGLPCGAAAVQSLADAVERISRR